MKQTKVVFLFYYNLFQKDLYRLILLLFGVKKIMVNIMWQKGNTPPYYKIFLSFTTFLSPKYGGFIIYDIVQIFIFIYNYFSITDSSISTTSKIPIYQDYK